MSVLSILNELASTNSSLEKVAILKREEKNSVLKSVFIAAYDTTVTYGIKQVPGYNVDKTSTYNSLDVAVKHLSKLASREFTGNAAISFLSNELSSLSEDDAVVLGRIIDRDLRCGTSDSLASRVWPALVPNHGVMLAHKDISGIKYPCYGQIKSDGARCSVYFDGVGTTALSRSGKPIQLHNVLDNDTAMLVKTGQTLDGELVCYKNGKALDRKTSNGIVNKAVKGTISKEEAELIRFIVWDIVDVTSTIKYSSRIYELSESYTRVKAYDLYQDKIEVMKTHIIYDEKQAMELFQLCLDAGEEGAMLKNMNGLWTPKRSKDIGKMKAVEENEMIIVDIIEGTGKYIGMLGALVCESSDSVIRVNVGTGFSDEERKLFFDESVIGKIITVIYNEVITSKNSSQKSLFLPRNGGLRFDKNIADTYDLFSNKPS